MANPMIEQNLEHPTSIFVPTVAETVVSETYGIIIEVAPKRKSSKWPTWMCNLVIVVYLVFVLVFALSTKSINSFFVLD